MGRFQEARGIPEDLDFLHDINERGFIMMKLDCGGLRVLLYHEHMADYTYHRKLLMEVRAAAFERIILGRPTWHDGIL